MNVIGYMALHYGSDYIYHSIKSVIDHVDQFYVLYSPVGSHGAHTDLPCPDNRQQLYELAVLAAGDKLRWVDNTWPDEGKQRESIHAYAPDADVILVVDADEIWRPISTPLRYWLEVSARLNHRAFRLHMIHYWRSFYRAVLHDPAFPERVLFPRNSGEVATSADVLINHMGYAQHPDVTYYKQFIHGHRGEWRWNEDWFHTIFMTNRQTDCHPVGSEYWNPEPVNPWDYMPALMKDHPYADLDVIGEVTEAAQ